MDQNEARARFAAARVARLATLAQRSQPYVVPVAFAVGSGPDGDAIAFAAEATSTAGFLTLQQVAAQPRVSVLVDHDDDDWSQSWWVRADGRARVLEAGATFRVALAGLSAKYVRYELEPPPGPVVLVDVRTWDWSEGSAS